jgi:hypothetical protein
MDKDYELEVHRRGNQNCYPNERTFNLTDSEGNDNYSDNLWPTIKNKCNVKTYKQWQYSAVVGIWWNGTLNHCL